MPASPIRSVAVTRTPSRSTRYWVSELMDIFWVSVTPAAFGSTRNRSTASSASPVRARTTSRSAELAKYTCCLVPVSVNPSPSASARSCTPRGPKPFSGSSQAGVRIAAPVATFGSHSSRWASEPARTSAPAETTQLTRCGVGANARPSSS